MPSTRTLLVAATCAVVAASTPRATRAQAPPPVTAAPFEAQPIARNLQAAWALAFAPDGRLFVTERVGRVRLVSGDQLAPEPWAVVPVFESAARNLEGGLMGVAVDPQFGRTKRIYVCYTHPLGGDRAVNRIAVFIEENGRGAPLTTLVDNIPGGGFHNGCRLKFGPDGKLYATTGDGYRQSEVAQALDSLGGKILRLNADGSVPADNPFPKSYVWSYGHRNSQGLAWQPGTNRLFATEHGTGPGGGNELNIIERGKNYGWPTVIGVRGDSRFVDPILVRPDAPAGATFVTSAQYPTLRGRLLIGTLFTQRILQVSVKPDASPEVDVLLQGTYGRIRDMIQGPDGYLYVATSNRDGRTTARAEDDRVLRLRPLR
jgi:glucose/arabinose dehydrogenase